MWPITEHRFASARHTTFYLACGSDSAPPIIFLHGWPELAISWRHQLAHFASLGFRAIAPDMRGYGHSSVYKRHEDYAIAHGVADMIELLDSLGHDKAVWVGHDHGSTIAWSIAVHHPQRCQAVANLCVPYIPNGFAPQNFIPLVNRAVYPQAEYPAGQWDYILFHEENFDRARAGFEANAVNTAKALFRAGDARGKGKPSRTASIRKSGGWFGEANMAPDVPMDTTVLSQDVLDQYVDGFTRNGFFGADSWYMNAERNCRFAAKAPNDGKITLPTLFVHAEYDFVCETLTSRLAEPMRQACTHLTEATIACGHWMAQEKPAHTNAAIVGWLEQHVPNGLPPRTKLVGG